MPCKDCDKNKNFVSFKILDEDCPKLPTGECTPVDATCLNYSGSPLSNLGLTTNINGETVFKAIDTYLGQLGGISYAGYNMHCLTDDQTITTEGEFVSAITSAYCDMRDDFDNFVSNTTDYDTLSARIDSIVNPGLNLCASTGVTSSDSYTDILVKLGQKICDLNDSVSLSSVNWSQCFTVNTSPIKVSEAFSLLVDQICQVKASVGQVTLPTFDTTLSCLDHKTSVTSLVDTVKDLIKVSCSAAQIDMSITSWGCYQSDITSQGNNLQAAIQVTANTLNYLTAYTYTFDQDQFIITPQGACQPSKITLKSPGGTPSHDNTFVGPDDPTGGDLIDKISAGQNISLINSTPTKIVIDAVETGKVRVSPSDTPGYLGDKITTSGNGPITVHKNVAESSVDLSASVDLGILADQLLTTIQNNPQLLAKLVNMVCGCGGYTP